MGKHDLLEITMAALIHWRLRNERESRCVTVRSSADVRQWTGGPFVLERRYPRKPNRINELSERILRLARSLVNHRTTACDSDSRSLPSAAP